jgi:CubicO group peptidase (beta-lactamase class C family)
MSASHASIPGSKESYGYGLEIGDWRGVRILHHGGSRAGYGSEIRMDPRERVGVIVQTNRTGGTLPETMERAFEMLVPLGSQESVKKKSVVPLSSEDLEQNAGNFQNGDERIEIVARDRQLYLKRPGASEVQMLKYSDTEYGLERGGGSFIMLRGGNARTEFVQTGLRAYARVH